MSEEVEGKTAALVSYITLVGALIAITMNMEPKHEFARFHTRQAFGLHVVYIALAIMVNQWLDFYAWAGLMLFYFVLWIYGFIGAINGKKQSVPVLGPYFQKWFTFIS